MIANPRAQCWPIRTSWAYAGTVAAKTTIGVRLDAALMARVEAYRGELRASMPGGVELTASDVVRVLLVRALDAIDAEKPKAKPKAK